MTPIENSVFQRLLGVWKTSGLIKTKEQQLTLTGIDSYELVLDGNFILHKATVLMGNENNATLEMIMLQDSLTDARMQYFNSKGENGTMTASIMNNDFSIEGNRLRFNGVINDESTLITGKWYMQSENDEWDEFIELVLERTGR